MKMIENNLYLQALLEELHLFERTLTMFFSAVHSFVYAKNFYSSINSFERLV